MKNFKNFFVVIAICSISLFACKKHDDCVMMKKGLPMSGSQDVPAVKSAAYGTMDVSYNKCDQMLKFTITWKNLTADPIGSHIHGPAAEGANAPVVYAFTDLIPKTTSGTFTNSVKVDGMAIKEDSLLAGYYYINIHTPMHPGGEIRGQIQFK